MRALLLSAYAARSHVYWQQQLVALFASWRWQVLSLPPRHFSWRVRGNPLHWALTEREILERDYDLLVATSMVDLATLRGLVPNLASIPSVLYFHENQFAYPQDRQQHSLLEAQMVSLYSALAADRIVFNSRYNRDSFFNGTEALLRRLPDKVPAGIVDQLQCKTSVLPVPMALAAMENLGVGKGWPGDEDDYPARPLRLVWVGRFEHDKGGEGLLCVLRELEGSGLNYELAMIGQQFRACPRVFSDIELQFSHRLVQFGYLESTARYRRFLHDADIVLSTAVHEFQGLAVLEAVAAGCLPVVPDRLVYPEIFAPQYCYPSLPSNPGGEALGAVQIITCLMEQLAIGAATAPEIAQFDSRELAPRYEALFLSLSEASAAGSQ